MSNSKATKGVPRKFAEITCLLEDMHAVAVEGHVQAQSTCFYKVLSNQIAAGCSKIDATIASINADLN